MTRRNPVVRYSRSYRRHPRFGMGLPPRRPGGRLRRFWRRMADPRVFLRAVIAVALVGLFLLPATGDAINAAIRAGVGADGGRCRIVSVIDGDTVMLWCAGSGVSRARLDGYDAPELFSPQCTTEYLAAQRATWALRWMIFRGDRMAITKKGEDRYGRALIALSLDGRTVAGRMIALGHARPYDGGARQGWCG